jgi:hypothetical protein
MMRALMLALAAVIFAIQACHAAGTNDPFAYCVRVGTIDTPSAGFASTAVPPPLEPYVRSIFRLPADAALTPGGFYWRCMNKAVYVCTVGANIPCGAKADVATRNRGASDYCRANPDASFVPAFASGHETIYEWRCSAGRAVRGSAMTKLDRRGYQTSFWYRVSLH